MDWSVILGVAGIAVSIMVGWLTYYLADKRQGRSRYLAAKSAIVNTLSRSLSEETIPSASLVEAMIRSVLRDENSSDLAAVSVDEVVDDLIRQVTADPFLPAERRKQLQDELLAVIDSRKHELPQTADAEEHYEQQPSGIKMATSLASVVIGILSALFTFLTFGNVFARLPTNPSPTSELTGGRSLLYYLHHSEFLSGIVELMALVIVIAALLAAVGPWLGRRH